MSMTILVVKESESQTEDEPIDDSHDDVEDSSFDLATPQVRNATRKKNLITPRLCNALDKAKVKRKRLKK